MLELAREFYRPCLPAPRARVAAAAGDSLPGHRFGRHAGVHTCGHAARRRDRHGCLAPHGHRSGALPRCRPAACQGHRPCADGPRPGALQRLRRLLHRGRHGRRTNGPRRAADLVDPADRDSHRPPRGRWLSSTSRYPNDLPASRSPESAHHRATLARHHCISPNEEPCRPLPHHNCC
jgi:hypothetical protein